MGKRRYRRKADQPVVAVRLDLETDGFTYNKWGEAQRCKGGDYLVDSAGDVYTVDRAIFESTYQRVGPGQYIKTGKVWAEQVAEPGVVRTKEGATHFGAGDYRVSNDEAGTDSWAVERAKFELMYELDD